ncbi:DUF3618 domain-containing protein [Streptomyces sp. NPDC045470]|uniref:DUF3618 domain-containing protein n=1 Tax=unclassified Streptomyces TaxID=2593676 RepID=UPI0033DACB80
MTRDPGKDGTASPAELRARIEQTRQELGDTVAALADKADVKSRAQEKAARVKDRTLHRTAAVTDRMAGSPAVRTAAVAGGALLAGVLVLRRRARSRVRPYPLRTTLRKELRTRKKSQRPLAKAGTKARRACRSKGHH